jgi:Fic/DOC family
MNLRLEPSAAAREKRLARLLAEGGLRRDDARLAGVVEDALLVGSLELAGVRVSWEHARASRETGVGPEELAALRRARVAVGPEAPVSLDAIRAWHAALAGPIGFRREPVESAPAAAAVERRGAPADFIEERLADLAEWLESAGIADLAPEAKAAVALARIVEIRPFDDANGRVSRLAAAHVLARAGLAPPILVAGDAARLQAVLDAAFRLETQPLVELVREASGRALEVMIQSLERGLV